MQKKVFIYDTTLRDGSQAEGISFSIEDKIKVALKLDQIGVDYIEGGWPGSNPKDVSFFEEIRKEKLKHAKIAAFGSTRRADVCASEDTNLKLLLSSHAPVITIFGKSWDFHVKEVLRVSLKENLDIIFSSVEFLKKHQREVIYDAEHFFDGYKHNPDYAIKTLIAAQDAGADCIVLCDTNGGSLPLEITNVINVVSNHVKIPIGIHCHNDSGLAVANSLMAVNAGAVHVQGTINGYGERCGNANLCVIIPNLLLKMDKSCLAKDQLEFMTEVSHYVDELANMVPDDRQPYVGFSAFAHKGGMHVNAVQKHPATFEHIEPEKVGNQRRILVSELSGRSNILLKSKEMKINLDPDSKEVKEILKRIKELENEGYEFEAADASFHLLIQKMLGKVKPFFALKDYRVIMEKHDDEIMSEATVNVLVNGVESYKVAVGDGPVNALDNALRLALKDFYPQINDVQLTDYKVRVLNGERATASKVRVWIESRDEQKIWATVGVSENLIEASLLALIDSVEYKLMNK